MSAQGVRSKRFAAPGRRTWTKAEYYRMADLGWFRGERVELIEGEIMVLSPQKWAHSATTDKATETLRKVFGPGYWVRMQLPLDLGQTTEPEADVSVVRGKREDYSDHPKTAVLAVEVSDSTLAYDRTRKSSLYARAGIEDFWIVDLIHLQLEIRRNPKPDASQRYGYRYTVRTIHSLTESVSPLAIAPIQITVADLFV
jgi:Uma2 family endonuclease